jgi:transcription initiation factor IIE alpha subunit
MQFTYTFDNLTDPKNQVRALAPDNRLDDVLNRYRFADEEIEMFLSLEGGNVKKAAALLLETRATDKADTEGYIKTYAIEVDETKAAKILLDRAAILRRQVELDTEVAELDGDLFDIG